MTAKIAVNTQHPTLLSLMGNGGAGNVRKGGTKVNLKRIFPKLDGKFLVFDGELRGRHIRPKGGLNNNVDLGVLRQSRLSRLMATLQKGISFIPGAMVVTDSGVAFMVDDWDLDTLNISDLNFHDSGIGIIAAAPADTDLGTVAGPTTRATGAKTQPAANQIRSVGTIAYTGPLAITEWGLFNAAPRATVNMWDRKVFAAINVVNLDSIQFTYTLTINSGG